MSTGIRVATFVLLLATALPLFAQDTVREDIHFDCNALQITGTFSNLAFDEAKQGLFGAEVRIVVTANSYQASLQFADGEAGDLSIGEVEFDKHLKYWPLGVPLPESEPDTDLVEIVIQDGQNAGVFRGKVQRTRLIGTYEFASGRKLSMDLPRTKGYWD